MNEQKRVLAIHDVSCVGRCSLTVALPILSAAGLNTGVLPTAVLSTHPGGFEGFTYRDLTKDIKPISDHWKSLDLKFDALYSGFLGSFDQNDLVAELFNTFRSRDTLILVDPVMADNGVLYSVYSKEMVHGMTKLCSLADIIVPNLTEAAFMLDEQYKEENYSREYIETMLKKLASLGAKKVVLTGIAFEKDKVGAAAYDSNLDKISYAFNNKVDGNFHGTGDIFASTLLAALLNEFSLSQAIRIAVDYTHKCVLLTAQARLERRYGVCFEKAIPYLIQKLGLLPEYFIE